MSFYNLDEEPTITGANIAEADIFPLGDASLDHTVKTGTTQAIREVMNRGLTNVTAATLAVTAASHAGHTITLNRAAGIAVTLPAATGTGNKYKFIIGTTVTSNSTTIKAASATDSFQGFSMVVSDGAAAVLGYIAAAGTDDTVTFDGTTTGGYVGDTVEITDVASARFQVEVRGKATGTEATPFSATVS